MGDAVLVVLAAAVGVAVGLGVSLGVAVGLGVAVAVVVGVGHPPPVQLTHVMLGSSVMVNAPPPPALTSLATRYTVAPAATLNENVRPVSVSTDLPVSAG